MPDEINKEEFVNPNLDNGREHRVGADLYDWDYNDTYDIDRVVPDVKTFIDQLYTHSLYSQGVLCDVSRIYGTMSKFVRDVNVNKELGIGYYNYTLEVPMKNIRVFKTLAIKRANPKIYTIEDTCKMTELFDRRLMMFIDGQYFPGVKFYATENRFILIIEVYNGNLSLKRMEEWIDNDVKWSILMLPFSTTMQKQGMQKDIIKGRYIPFKSLDTISTPLFVNRNLWLTSVGNLPSEKAVTTSCIASMITNSDGELCLDLPAGFVLGINSVNITTDVVAIPNAKGGILLNSARAFQIELDTNPIPPQNILCWATNEDGSVVRYVHDAEITLYYPNVYTIGNVPDDVHLFVTWCYSDEDTTHFFNPLEEYMKYNSSYANDVLNNTLPYTIKTYIPYESKYRELYYLDYEPKATKRNEYLFKFETLKDMIKDDTRRLEKIYTDNVIKTAYNWHSSPKYTINIKDKGYTDLIRNRTRLNTSKEIKYSDIVEFGLPCVYFILEHEDDREYPISVWVDGRRCNTLWQFTEGYRTFVYVPVGLINEDSLLEFEVMKTRSDKATVVDLQLSNIHNSTLLPEEFVDISPQSLMIATREETSDFEDDGSMQYIYKIAPDYEVYWLLIGNTEYINGVPSHWFDEDPATAKKSNINNALTSNSSLLMTENDEALKLSTGSLWDKTDDGYTYFLEFGGKLDFFKTISDEYPEDYRDIFKVRELGYYGDARRRFYGYLPNGEDDTPIYITPITKYFADKWVRLTNIDIYKEWHFKITPEDKRFKLRDFRLEPNANKFRVYLDGRLLDPFKDYHFDASIPNGFYLGSIITFVILEKITETADVMVEYIPYRYELKYRLDNVTNSNIQLRTAVLTRPFSLVYYDVYLNGVKLYKDDITIVSPAKIIINHDMVGQTVSIYERCHDTDIYDNERVMLQAIVDKIAEEDSDFKKFLLPNFTSEDEIIKEEPVPTTPEEKPGYTQMIKPSGSSNGCIDCGTGCSINCTGICENSCSLTCSGSCADSCSSTSSATSCNGCSSACHSECSTNCESNCKLRCTSTCANDCIGTCENSCSGTVTGQVADQNIKIDPGCDACSAMCTLTCTGDCSGTATSANCSGCDTTCMRSCTGCTGSCDSTLSGIVSVGGACSGCTGTCDTECTGCVGTCSGCTGTCDSACTGNCLETCSEGCKGTCNETCSGNATGAGNKTACSGCYSTCTGTCATTCGDNCTIGCTTGCGSTCGDTCKTNCTGTCLGHCTSCTGLSTAKANSIAL